MKSRSYLFLAKCSLLLLLCLGLSACQKEEELIEREDRFDEYMVTYNAYIKSWVSTELTKQKQKLIELDAKIENNPEDRSLSVEKAEVKKQIQGLEHRQKRGDYFQVKSMDELPEGIKWTSGEKQPEIGDPRAKKGGVFRDYTSEFPPSFRRMGPQTNHTMRGKLYDELEVRLIHWHPTTDEAIPGVAREWAISDDGRTLWYKLDPDAAYSDGVKVEAIDYLYNIYYFTSNNVQEPYYKQFFRKEIGGLTAYGTEVLEVSLPTPKPRSVSQYPVVILPAPKHFYKNYGPDYTERYNWKVVPTTGAYYVDEDGINKGVSITLTRNKDWWAKDKRYYRYRYNADKIVHQYVQFPTKAFELFKVGALDYFEINSPRYWYEKTEIDNVFNGYIEKYKFYNQFARVPRGIYINAGRGLCKDRDVRIGFNHAMNWQKIIDVMFRGDYSRLDQFYSGFGKYVDTSIKAREFSPEKARAAFKRAGFTEVGDDGILQKPDGTRLKISITFDKKESVGRVMALLKEEAKICGLDFELDAVEATAAYEKVMRKEHESTFWGWGSEPPLPSAFQFFHSSNAVDKKGNPKPNTNNINGFGSPEGDKATEASRSAENEEQLVKAMFDVQRIVHEEAIFNPAYKRDYEAIATWRWLRFPDTETMPVCYPILKRLQDSYVWWIDEDMKAETKAAMRDGKTFPEVQRIEDTFKDGIPDKYKRVID